MKKYLPLCLLGLAACGDISDQSPMDELRRQDAEFSMALPSAQDVAMDGPDDGSTTQGLQAEVNGLTRQICVGMQATDIFCNGHVQAAQLNAITRGLLAIVDGVRSLTPTSRSADGRSWGPYPDRDPAHAGRTWEAHVRRAAADTCVDQVAVDDGAGAGRRADGRYVYRWSIDVRVDGGDALHVLTGCFRPGRGGTASGVGRMVWNGRISRERLHDAGAETMNRLAIDYDLLSDERRILATFVGAQPDGSDGQELRFGSRRADDGSGGWGYLLRLDVDRVGAVDELAVRARWRADRAGRADAQVTLGDSRVQFFVRQCWGGDIAQSYLEIPEFGGRCPDGTATNGAGLCTDGNLPSACVLEPLL
jgi:hypothetical protein